ncbi:tetratricopeptide repeat protein [Bacteroidota bacterium]
MSEDKDGLYSEEEINSAVNRFKEFTKSGRDCYFDVFEYEGIIDYFFEHNMIKKASVAIDLADKQHPYSVSLRVKKAQLCIYKGQAQEAILILNLAEKLERNNIDIYILKGNALLLLDKPNEAEKQFDAVIKTSTEDLGRILNDIAFAYEQSGYFKFALKYFKKALKLDPQNGSLLYDIAFCYEKTHQSEKSILYYNKYLKEYPFSKNAWHNLANQYYETEEFDKAIEAYDFAIAIDPDFINAFFNKANCLNEAEKYAEAIKTYKEILLTESDNPVVYTYIGECYERLNDYKKAIDNYNLALDNDNEFSDAWFGIGLVKLFEEKYFESISYVKKAIKFNSSNSEYYYALGNVNTKLGFTKDALIAYKDAIDNDPEDVGSWLASAEIMFKQGEMEKAINFLESGYDITKEYANINYRLATYHFLKDNKTQGLKYFTSGLKQNFDEHLKVLKDIPDKNTISEIQNLINKLNKK